MMFPVAQGREAIVPPALAELDERLGANTSQAYIAALSFAPNISGVQVVLNESLGAHFVSHPYGLEYSKISLNPDPEHYREQIRSGVAKTRFAEFSGLYRQLGIRPGLGEMAVVGLLHEAGHADQFTRHIAQAAGQAALGFDLRRAARLEEVQTLPLGGPTSIALTAWNNNTEGYRDKLIAQGITDERWQELTEKNTRTYMKLPSESGADQFALSIIATARPS